MVKIIVGDKGTGKTRKMLEILNENLSNTKGDIVFIGKSVNLGHNLNSKVRLIDVEDYSIKDYSSFYGFFAGILAGNYDIEQIYIDEILQDVGSGLSAVEKFISDAEILSKNIKVVLTVCAEENSISQQLKQYIYQ